VSVLVVLFGSGRECRREQLVPGPLCFMAFPLNHSKFPSVPESPFTPLFSHAPRPTPSKRLPSVSPTPSLPQYFRLRCPGKTTGSAPRSDRPPLFKQQPHIHPLVFFSRTFLARGFYSVGDVCYLLISSPDDASRICLFLPTGLSPRTFPPRPPPTPFVPPPLRTRFSGLPLSFFSCFATTELDLLGGWIFSAQSGGGSLLSLVPLGG